MKTRRAINKEELKNVLLELMSEDADFRREISVLLLREEPVTRSYLDESLIKLSKQFDDKLLELRREIAEENKAMRAEFWEEMRKLREEMARENQAMRAEFWEEIRKLREEMAGAMRAEFWEEIRREELRERWKR
jgi:5'-3' exonuclease